MSESLHHALQSIGLSDSVASGARVHFDGVARTLASATDAAGAHAWWVPGRIEVLGKHTDYAGGRSLLCTVERGFHVMAAPRSDSLVRLIDAASGETEIIRFAATTDSRPGHWSDYPISVVRRLARDAGASRGADIVFHSTLPPASGLSSSSALVIATYLALAAVNALDTDPAWANVIPDLVALAGYLGAVENGKAFGTFAADRGVGTHGGSEDQTAILCCEAGRLSQYRFLPVMHERTVALPDQWTFAVAMSGVHAAKGGGAQQRYNHLAAETAQLLLLWNRRAFTHHASLLSALESNPNAVQDLLAWVDDEGSAAAPLARRVRQFADESLTIIPTVAELIAGDDVEAIGPLVAQSQALAESTLRNQIPETIHLVRRAGELGAVAASAFGAGFGGSVWALVRACDAERFLGMWRDDYTTRFGHAAPHADFFLTRPGPPASALGSHPLRP